MRVRCAITRFKLVVGNLTERQPAALLGRVRGGAWGLAWVVGCLGWVSFSVAGVREYPESRCGDTVLRAGKTAAEGRYLIYFAAQQLSQLTLVFFSSLLPLSPNLFN